MDISLQDQTWLKHHPLFSSLSSEEFLKVLPFIQLIHIGAAETIIDMRKATHELYIIKSGTAKTYDPKEKNMNLTVAYFHPGDIIGEASFLTQSDRLCDVIAQQSCELFSLSEQLMQRESKIYDMLVKILEKLIINRIKQSNQEQIRLQKKYIELLESQIQFSRFFIACIMVFSLVIFVNFALNHYLKTINIYSPWFARTYLVLIAIPLIIIAKINKQPLSMFGLTIDNWKNACIRGIIIAFFLSLGIIFIKVIINWQHQLPLFYSALYSFKKMPPWTYCFSVILQQAIRAFLQNSLNKIFINNTIYSIFFSSFIFGLFHIHFGLIAVIITFFVGILFALVYLKDRNIIGLTIAHTLIGWLAFATGLI